MIFNRYQHQSTMHRELIEKAAVLFFFYSLCILSFDKMTFLSHKEI